MGIQHKQQPVLIRSRRYVCVYIKSDFHISVPVSMCRGGTTTITTSTTTIATIATITTNPTAASNVSTVCAFSEDATVPATSHADANHNRCLRDRPCEWSGCMALL